jgi:FliI/YscN family ATPase
MFRQRIREQLPLGIRAIDAMTPCGQGQRVGVFAAAGGGKSTLMGMIARYAAADVKVVVLIGERGREVLEFIQDSLGPEGKQKSVVVVATSNDPAVVRIKSAYIGTTIAEYFRDAGKKVILMMDSITRFARALREIGLARGEPPARYGFPPSVFAELPRLFERCGNSEGRGSMTGIYTVLVEGDNLDEPVADETKSLLDGHIILSSKVPYYPRIDIVGSESRVFGSLGIEEAVGDAVRKVRDFAAIYRRDEAAMNFGAFDEKRASRRRASKELVDKFMTQTAKEGFVPLQKTRDGIKELASKIDLQ